MESTLPSFEEWAPGNVEVSRTTSSLPNVVQGAARRVGRVGNWRGGSKSPGMRQESENTRQDLFRRAVFRDDFRMTNAVPRRPHNVIADPST